MRKLVSAAGFYALCTLLSPLILIGYVMWVAKTITTGRSGVSVTAQGPLTARFSEHNFGTRQDEAANQLLRVLPGVSRLGLWLTTGPVLLAHRLTGYVPHAFRYPFEGKVPPQYQASARIWFFDAAVDRHLPDMAQFVILGAGFDTRAYRLPTDTRVRVFEVDSPRTQVVKRETLEKAGLDAGGVTFVPADFEKQDWLACLTSAGFDPGEPTLFLWEGVTMYLNHGADGRQKRRRLRLLHLRSPRVEGTVLAFRQSHDEGRGRAAEVRCRQHPTLPGPPGRAARILRALVARPAHPRRGHGDPSRLGRIRGRHGGQVVLARRTRP